MKRSSKEKIERETDVRMKGKRFGQEKERWEKRFAMMK